MANRLYTKTEESGFGDPLIGNDDNFDIFQYIGAGDTPEGGSPAAFGGNACNNSNSHIIYQQQQQQLLNTTASELVQALHAPTAVGAVHQQQLKEAVAQQHNGFHHHQQQQLQQQQQAMVFDNVGLMMYSNNNGAELGSAAAAGRNRVAIEARGGQTRLLPDSPPITDASGGASSISPGSSGGASSSPFSPDQYRYVHPQEMNGSAAAAAEVLLIQQNPRGEMLLMNNHHNQMGQMMGSTGHHRGLGMLVCGGNGGGGCGEGDGMASAAECLHSPNSEFLSPYPPSQSTPGSHHSAQQISPPAIAHPPKGLSYLLQSQSANAFVASMDNIYTASSDEMSGGEAALVGQHQQQQNFNNHPQSQLKRRRMSSSATPGSRDASSMPLGNSTNLPNIKSEVGTTATQANGTTANSNSRRSPQHQCAAVSADQQQQQQRMLLLHAQQQQQHHHHQSFDDLDENMNSQRTIKFEPYLCESWNVLYDINQRPLKAMPIAVVADKGFNYSASDNCFVNQKKNHFQITVSVTVDLAAASASSAANASGLSLNGGGDQPQQPNSPFTPRYVRVNGVLQPIIDADFYLAFCGVKNEMQTSLIKIKQSQADRKPIDHDPEGFKIDGTRPAVRQTVARLHFAETTLNNHRKNGKPNPEQRFFLLVVKLLASTPSGPVLVQAFHSDRVIVRASNPGQFEQPDQELNWQRGQHGSLSFPGQVCIGTSGDKPIDNAALTVYGNIVTTGTVTKPSDRRVKENIAEVSTAEAMARVAQMRLVEFAYKPDIAQRWGLSEQDRHRVGVIAQELAEVLPEAVKDNGEFLTVDDTRVFYDTVAAAQELYRLTGNLGSKLDQVEKISQKLARYAQKRRQLGSMASGLSDFSTFFGTKSAVDDGGDCGAAASLAGVKQNCVSHSRTSLTSAATTMPAHCGNDLEDGGGESFGGVQKTKKDGRRRSSSERYHHRCRSYSSASAYCNRPHFYGSGGGGGGGAGSCAVDSPLCNSKFTQGTIVTLVIVMALCLVTMCTLYVLDWYNRTYVFPVQFHRDHYHPTTNPLPDADRGRQAQQPIEPGKMIKPFVEWKLPDRPQNVPPLTVFCGGGAITSFSSLISVPIVPPSSCPLYCCANNKLAYENFGQKLSKSVDNLVALASKVAENVVPPAPQLLIQEHPNKIDELNTLANGAKFEILNLNFTIDARYCLNESCDARNGHFNLFVPISEHFPTIPLQIRISTDDPTLFVDDCGGLLGFPYKPCQQFGNKQLQLDDETNGSRPPGSNRVAENIFELSAGSFLQSAYRFRVGHFANVCQHDERQRGRTFDEFNLIFYRTCAVKPAAVNGGDRTTETPAIASAAVGTA
uniref:Myelin regulatory factor n=1 Tax=Globodera rostochiensis TaxID=31243 RepID=A0A914H3Z9_GLORO